MAHLLEGSVQRANNRVRVNAQLIDARDERISGHKLMIVTLAESLPFKARSPKPSPTSCKPSSRQRKRMQSRSAPPQMSPHSISTVAPKNLMLTPPLARSQAETADKESNCSNQALTRSLLLRRTVPARLCTRHALRVSVDHTPAASKRTPR